MKKETQQRGTGETTRQMLNAPRNSVFVWCNDYTKYPEELAKFLGRTDLDVRPLWWWDVNSWSTAGREPVPVIFDHAIATRRNRGQRS